MINMEQTLLEEKVNNALRWFACQIAFIQLNHCDENYEKKSLNDIWEKFQEFFKKYINWNTLTESQCNALHFARWYSEEDASEEISCLQSEFDKGNLTKDEFNKKVANSKSIIGLRLIPIYLYPLLPIGITLTSISGKEIVFNGSNIDTDTMQGYMSWGIKPKNN